MKFGDIEDKLLGIPFMQPEQARTMYEHVRSQQPHNVLELGIGHGVSSCYIAAALHENGHGHLTCVDLADAAFEPSAEELLKRVGLDSYASVYRENSSYTWFLKKRIEIRTPQASVCEPEFDLCYIDGPKNWTVDGAAFFMVDKLLTEGGWLIFDDYDWTYAEIEADSSDGISMLRMADDERHLPHIAAIFHLLVMQHPNYSEFRVDGNTWAWARKSRSGSHEVRFTYSSDLRYVAYTRLRALARRVRSRLGARRRAQRHA